MRSCVAIVPNIANMKQKRTKISNIAGKLLAIVDTNPDIPGTALRVLKGLAILTVRTAEIS